ncbi:hypothetical protein D3C83_323890 [compost metagenome]
MFFGRPLLAFVVLVSTVSAASAAPQPWQAYTDPAQVGFSAAKLEEARAFAALNPTCAGSV